jgi:hypothetical protein
MEANMDRRAFFGSLGTVAVGLASQSSAQSLTRIAPNVVIHFVGMFGFVRRSDGSLVAATPGPSSMAHLEHSSFLMARKGSVAASILGLTPYPGVVPSAIDPRLEDTTQNEFVFACTGNVAFEVTSTNQVGVAGVPAEVMQMQRIAPGKPVRRDLMKWAELTVVLQSGRLVNETVHPDANKQWRFGSTHVQHLTDAVRYESSDVVVRMTHGSEVRDLRPDKSDRVEFWVVSAPTNAAAARTTDPTKLTHSEALFDFLVDATPIIGECPEAVGGRIRETAFPCSEPKMAALGSAALPTFPWLPEWCNPGYFESPSRPSRL